MGFGMSWSDDLQKEENLTKPISNTKKQKM